MQMCMIPSFEPISGSTSDLKSSSVRYHFLYQSAKALRRMGSP